MRRVVIATPALDGRVDAFYAYSLAETVRLGMSKGVHFLPLLVTRDALIQRARNDLARMFMESDATDVIWIDSDIGWGPDMPLRLLSHSVDVVGGTYRRKTDGEAYVCKADLGDLVADARGLMTVEALGTGFLRVSRKAMAAVWEAAPPYQNEGRSCRMVFPVAIVGGDLVSEDVMFCRALTAAGFPIHLDPSITCLHVGAKTWEGDFAAWCERLLRSPSSSLTTRP